MQVSPLPDYYDILSVFASILHESNHYEMVWFHIFNKFNLSINILLLYDIPSHFESFYCILFQKKKYIYTHYMLYSIYSSTHTMVVYTAWVLSFRATLSLKFVVYNLIS